MPLHAITATYGDEGLRERFAAEIASFPDAERRRLGEALALAAELHATDQRQNEPYLNHLLRVAIRILSHYGVRDADVAIAACCTTRLRTTPRGSPRTAARRVPSRFWPAGSGSASPTWLRP